ncbi:MAG: hypothetical protein HRO68_05710 [Nitrosopumilus sp.]|nr:hypothetical protein [Nitrosopumilus sp.]
MLNFKKYCELRLCQTNQKSKHQKRNQEDVKRRKDDRRFGTGSNKREIQKAKEEKL